MWQQKVGVNEGGVGDLNDTHTDGATEHDHWQYDSSKKYGTKDDK